MQKCAFCFIMAPAGPGVTGQKKLPRSQRLDRISALLPHPEKKSRERQTDRGGETFNAHFTSGQPYQNISIIPSSLGPQSDLLSRGTWDADHSRSSLPLILLDFPIKKTHWFSPCLSDPCARDPGREGPGPDSPAWDYGEKVVFKWKARLSKLTLANLPLHIQPLLALASQVKHSGSATQTLTGLCCTTLLFSLTLLGAGEIIQHTWEWRSHSPSNFNYLSWLAEALKFG